MGTVEAASLAELVPYAVADSKRYAVRSCQQLPQESVAGTIQLGFNLKHFVLFIKVQYGYVESLFLLILNDEDVLVKRLVPLQRSAKTEGA